MLRCTRRATCTEMSSHMSHVQSEEVASGYHNKTRYVHIDITHYKDPSHFTAMQAKKRTERGSVIKQYMYAQMKVVEW